MKNLGFLVIALSDDSYLIGGFNTEGTSVHIVQIQRKPLVSN
jgi:hypothetical protein